MDWFSTEVCLSDGPEPSRFRVRGGDGRERPVVAIDYVNDQCDVDVQSRWPGAPPDAVVRRVADRFADAADHFRPADVLPFDAPRRAANEEDVALSAFASFCRGAERVRFPQLTDRSDLWKLLVVITARKALDQVAAEHAKRRGGGTGSDDPRMSPGTAHRGEIAIEEIVGDEPTPEFAAQVAEEYERLLDLLGDDTLRRVAVWKMEGLTTDEIAEKLDCSRRTVARKLETIRIIWSGESTP